MPPSCQSICAVADNLPAACPIGRSTAGNNGHSPDNPMCRLTCYRQADPLRKTDLQSSESSNQLHSSVEDQGSCHEHSVKSAQPSPRNYRPSGNSCSAGHGRGCLVLLLSLQELPEQFPVDKAGEEVIGAPSHRASLSLPPPEVAGHCTGRTPAATAAGPLVSTAEMHARAGVPAIDYFDHQRNGTRRLCCAA